MLPEYLLDTSALRALNDEDEKRIPERVSFTITAGMLVPFELISGLPSHQAPSVRTEFKFRSAAMRRLLRLCGYQNLYMRTPDDIRCAAFGAVDQTPYVDFMVLMESFAQSKDADTFYAVQAKARVLSSKFPTADWLRAESEYVTQTFQKSVKQTHEHFRRVNQDWLNKRAFSRKEKRTLNRGLVPFMNRVGDLQRHTLLALASNAGVWRDVPPADNLYQWTLEQESHVRRMYDGSLDAYIAGYCEYTVRKWLSGSSAERNDSFDVDQFTYLRADDASQVLVTADDELLSLAGTVLPRRAMHLVEFRHKLQEP